MQEIICISLHVCCASGFTGTVGFYTRFFKKFLFPVHHRNISSVNSNSDSAVSCLFSERIFKIRN